ncbi:MAG: putative protein N(5)-glutamine methyltransferase, partial [Nocardioides sp.]
RHDAAVTVVSRLRAAGCVFAEQEAALLVEAAIDGDELETLVRARESGTPLEYLLGWAEFDGVRVRITDGVFVPRQRSQLLAELAGRLAPSDGVVVDLCCGSGALLAAVLRRRRDLDGHAVDLDPVATDCARLNLPADRVYLGDLFDPLPDHLRGHVDVLVVNAPYVPTSAIDQLPSEARDHEHLLALDGGPDGLSVHRRVAAEATRWLSPVGVLLIEVATEQVAAARAMFDVQGLHAILHTDPERGATVLAAAREWPDAAARPVP